MKPTFRRIARKGFRIAAAIGVAFCCLPGDIQANEDAAASSLQLLAEMHNDRLAKLEHPLENLKAGYIKAVEDYKAQAIESRNPAATAAAEKAIEQVNEGALPDNKSDFPPLARLANIFLEHRVNIFYSMRAQQVAAEKEYLADIKTVVARFTSSGNLDAARIAKEHAQAVEEKIKNLANSTLPPARATRNTPFVNSLDMRFVPGGTTNVLVSIWQTRVKDYETYAEATGTYVREAPFRQGPDHPVVNVNWHDAEAFCTWLTHKEREEGRIGPNAVYRLPTDAEWSSAARLPREQGATPAEKSERIRDVYPWGGGMPPTRNSGNYHPDFNADNFEHTAPVGSFRPNQFGLYDIGSNVWEMCDDWYDPATRRERVIRGSSFITTNESWLLLSSRRGSQENHRSEFHGFRVVLDLSI